MGRVAVVMSTHSGAVRDDAAVDHPDLNRSPVEVADAPSVWAVD